MFKTANEVTEHINEETDVELELTNLRCHLDCIADAETIEDSLANVVEYIAQNNRAASDRSESTRDVAAAPVDFVVRRRWGVLEMFEITGYGEQFLKSDVCVAQFGSSIRRTAQGVKELRQVLATGVTDGLRRLKVNLAKRPGSRVQLRRLICLGGAILAREV